MTQNALTVLAEFSKLQVSDIGKGVLTNTGRINSSDITDDLFKHHLL